MTNSLPRLVNFSIAYPIHGMAAFFLLLLISCKSKTPTALDHPSFLPQEVAFGVNTGYFPPFWSDSLQAALAKSSGCTTLRTGLFHHVLAQWGYEKKAQNLAYCRQLGLGPITGILGYPSPGASDPHQMCPDSPSTLFSGLYLPIWDDGANQTPVNDQNAYALYVWKVANSCKGLIGIYEVWNEPDAGWGGLEKGQPGNWWDSPPPPCQTGFKASVFAYIRMLRITYEVVKRADPSALVAVGGLGWPSYLDAICRYSDQPENGQVGAPGFPLPGGAYFDCMSFHAYPHLYALTKTDPISGITSPNRHSDAALEGLWQRKQDLEEVLYRHGFDNIRYPAKSWICTEFNLPRISVAEQFGNEKAQVNFVLKALFSAPKNGVRQMHLYALADALNPPSINPEFGFMGLYPPLDTILPKNIKGHLLVTALQWYSKLMDGYKPDVPGTHALQLPVTVDGALFINKKGQKALVLWAKTHRDMEEDTTFSIPFPQTCQNQLWQCFRLIPLTAQEPSGQYVQLTACPAVWKQVDNW
ncbi:MAG TPA: hypothetical protein VK168_17775 [Saprospiraceae bacterium]|nr:hypothetical protein [Saprospiraceae bacterium]